MVSRRRGAKLDFLLVYGYDQTDADPTLVADALVVCDNGSFRDLAVALDEKRLNPVCAYVVQ